MQELLIFLFEIAPTESNYQQIKSEIVSKALTSSSVEDENTTEEEERSQNITCHIVALADLVMSEKPTWTPYNKPMDEARLWNGVNPMHVLLKQRNSTLLNRYIQN